MTEATGAGKFDAACGWRLGLWCFLFE
jgi:hypothetical protein